MFAAILGSACAIILALFGAAWMLSGRVSGVESQVAALDSKVERHLSDTLPAQLEAAILKHQIKCPANVRSGVGGTNPGTPLSELGGD